MILLSLKLSNPWTKDTFRNLFCREKKFAKNKAYSFELLYHSPMIVELSVELGWRGHDHAGPVIEIGLLGYSIRAAIYDTRHWDSKKNCWTQYD